jgi:hypothetical protein
MERAKFYSSEVLLALKFLHKKGIVYRFGTKKFQYLNIEEMELVVG